MNSLVHDYNLYQDQEVGPSETWPDDGVSTYSFDKALKFLEDYTTQAQVYLAEMKEIQQEMRIIPGCMQHQKLEMYERDCNRIFEKLKQRICRFMKNSQGIKM